jgi:alpha,alpha-trehalase
MQAGNYREKAQRRRAAILHYCWNAAAGFFFDYNHVRQTQSERFTLAGVFPLFFNVATAEQAQRVAECVEQKFLHPGGLTTTLAATGQQWDAPNGWAPLQWMTYQGLANYGHTELAAKIRRHWMQNNEKVYAETGKMMEKYNVTDLNLLAGGGEYPNQDGFGWTNGVYLGMR